MYRYSLFTLSFLMSFIFSFAASESGAGGERPLRVVLKLDDTWPVDGKLSERWLRVDAFCGERGIPYTVGVICKTLEGDNPEFIASLRTIAASGRAEFWHHGYDHKQWEEDGRKVWEFKGSGYAHQLEHLQRAQALAKEKLGVTLTTFGAPYNATDADTVKALDQMPDITVWMFAPRDVQSTKFTTPQISAVNIEHPTHKPNFEQFKAGYAEHKTDPYLVMQGHPMSWDAAAFAEFVRIVDFLQAEGVTFVFPRDLVK
jgi:peptidoglycan/xylan/chitin deacetylase (PgdA/CDA1 family)